MYDHLFAICQRPPLPAGVAYKEAVHEHLRCRVPRNVQRSLHLQRLQAEIAFQSYVEPA